MAGEGRLRRLDVRQVEEFVGALDDALHDVEVEKQRRVVFAYDADVTIATILGATAQLEAAPPLDAGDPCVATRSLLGTGAFGKLRMLRPHLVEFDRVIRTLPRPAGKPPKGYFDAQRERLKKMWGFDVLERWLHANKEKLATEPRKFAADDAIWEEFSRFIDTEGFTTFVAAELCFGGAWFNRLNSLMSRGILSFESFGQADTFDLRGRRFEEFLQELEFKRTAPRARVSNIVDAAALDTIHSLAVSGLTLGLEYRFYTETQSVRETLRAAPFDVSPDSTAPPRRSLLRTETYFLVRASFPQLRPDNLRAPRGPQSDRLDLSRFDLRQLHRELQRVVSDLRPDEDVERALANYSVLGTPLNVLLSDFFRLSFVWEYVRGRARRAEALRQMLPDLVTMLRDEAVWDATRQSLSSALDGVKEEIRRALGNLQTWKAVVDETRKAVDRQRVYFAQAKEHRGDDPLPSVEYDLGLVRWGIERHLTTREQLEALIQALMLGSESEEILQCAYLANLFVQKDLGEEDSEFILLALWWLREWKLLRSHWKQRVRDGSRLWLEFRPLVLIAAAREFFEEADNPTNLEHLVRRCEMLVDEAQDYRSKTSTEATHGYRDMCVAHVSYWVWQILRKVLEKATDGASTAEQARVRAAQAWVADVSYDAGISAWRSLPKESPARVFALNHCAYLGTIAHMRPHDTRVFMRQLNEHTTSHRNFRIADTLAKPFSMKAEELVLEHGVERVRADPQLRKEVLDNLDLARNYLQEGRPFFGDDEATKHLTNVQNDLNLFR